MAYSLAHIAREFSIEVEGDSSVSINGVCGLSDNLPHHLSFVSSAKFLDAAANSRIPAFITPASARVSGKINLIHDNPDFAISEIGRLFLRPSFTQVEAHHPSAVIDPSASIAPTARIGANCVVGAEVQIGQGTIIHHGTVILDRVSIGVDCQINANCVIREDCILEDPVLLQPGVVLGADGFGYVRYQGKHVKTPQLGIVIVESDVEIGANSTVDRARFAATRIGRGSKIDNLVAIAHNVQIGERCIVVAQAGVAGSSRLGKDVTLAGQVGVVGHVSIGDGVTVLGQGMVTKDIREAGAWGGSPARPAKQWRRAIARLYAGLKGG